MAERSARSRSRPYTPSRSVSGDSTPVRSAQQYGESVEVEDLEGALKSISVSQPSVTKFGDGGKRGKYSSASIAPYTRPDHIKDKRGVTGMEIQCLTNYVEVLNKADWMVYQYHVSFAPIIDSRQIRSELLRKFRHVFGEEPVFDGMILYMPRRLPEDINTYTTILERTGQEMTLTVKLTNELPADDAQCMTIFNLCNRKAFQLSGYRQMGRHYYNPNASITIDRHKIDIWPGIISSIRLHEEQLLMCCEMSHKLLRTDSVLQFLLTLYNQFGPQRFREKALQGLVGTSVLTRYNNKTYRVDDIMFDVNPTHTFQMADGSVISYKDYYSQHYNKKITDATQPMLLTRGKAVGGESRDMFLVPELCSMTGLSDQMRSDRRIMQDIAQYTRVNPDGRVRNGTNYLTNFQQNDPAMGVFRTWGLELDKKLFEIDARVLPPESLLFSQNKKVNYDKETADWSRQCRSIGLYSAMKLDNWMIFFDKPDRSVAELFFRTIKSMENGCGMNISEPNVIELEDNLPENFVDQIKKAVSKNKDCKIVVAFVPNDNKTRYDGIKKTCCLDVPVPSQVVRARSLDKNTISVCSKILLQINCKLGGSLWRIDVPLKSAMVIGYDAYHDSAHKNVTVGAAVSSYDQSMTRWYSQCALHKEVNDLVSNLKGFCKKSLLKYQAVSGVLPEKIFFFRDGVGDGHIPVVINEELPKIQEAFEEIDPRYHPKLAFIIVTKRVNSRFYQKVGQRVDNPPPGTVVDTGITKRERYDFYLVPQKVTQGTVTPVSYNVIHDDTGLQPDHMQRFAYKMCHLYYNWQGTIRVPAPCQYAHKLAFLTGQTLHRPANEVLADKLYFL